MKPRGRTGRKVVGGIGRDRRLRVEGWDVIEGWVAVEGKGVAEGRSVVEGRGAGEGRDAVVFRERGCRLIVDSYDVKGHME